MILLHRLNIKKKAIFGGYPPETKWLVPGLSGVVVGLLCKLVVQVGFWFYIYTYSGNVEIWHHMTSPRLKSYTQNEKIANLSKNKRQNGGCPTISASFSAAFHPTMNLSTITENARISIAALFFVKKRQDNIAVVPRYIVSSKRVQKGGVPTILIKRGHINTLGVYRNWF